MFTVIPVKKKLDVVYSCDWTVRQVARLFLLPVSSPHLQLNYWTINKYHHPSPISREMNLEID